MKKPARGGQGGCKEAACLVWAARQRGRAEGGSALPGTAGNTNALDVRAFVFRPSGEGHRVLLLFLDHPGPQLRISNRPSFGGWTWGWRDGATVLGPQLRYAFAALVIALLPSDALRCGMHE